MRKGVAIALAVAVAMLAAGSVKASDVGGAAKGPAVNSTTTDVAKDAGTKKHQHVAHHAHKGHKAKKSQDHSN